MRSHGPHPLDEPYRGRYRPGHLATLADRLGSWLSEGADVYAYFNNDYEGNAVADARRLRAQLDPDGAASSRRQPAPSRRIHA